MNLLYELNGITLETDEAIKLACNTLKTGNRILVIGRIASGKSYLLQKVYESYDLERKKLKEEYQNEYPMPTFVDPYSEFTSDFSSFMNSKSGGMITAQGEDIEDALSKIAREHEIDMDTLPKLINMVIVANGGRKVYDGPTGIISGPRRYDYIFLDSVRLSALCSLWQTDKNTI